MSKVIYGVDGIRQRNYRVWINFEDMTSGAGELNFITAVDKMGDAFVEISDTPPQYSNAKTELDLLKAVMYHIGEMRADSIDLAVEDGDSVEGNEVGKIVMGKNGKFSSELINSTPDILTWLGQRDTKECIIMLEEMDSTRLKNYDGAMLETHEIIFIGNVPAMAAGLTDNVGASFNYVEKITGKNIATSTINVEKTVPTAGAFRKIFDFRYEEPVSAPQILTLENSSGNNIHVVLDTWGGKSGDADFFRMEFSANDANFGNIYHIHDTESVDDVEYNFDSSITGHIWVRISAIKNGISKSVYVIDQIEI